MWISTCGKREKLSTIKKVGNRGKMELYTELSTLSTICTCGKDVYKMPKKNGRFVNKG